MRGTRRYWGGCPKLPWSPWLCWDRGLQLSWKQHCFFSCCTGEHRPLAVRPRRSERVFYGKGTWKNWPTLMRQSRTVNPTVSTVWAESNIGPLLPSDWHCHNPHEIVCVPSSYLETFRSPLGSGISLCYGKLFSLNILNSIFSKSLKTFEGHLLSIHDFCINYLFLVL